MEDTKPLMVEAPEATLAYNEPHHVTVSATFSTFACSL